MDMKHLKHLCHHEIYFARKGERTVIRSIAIFKYRKYGAFVVGVREADYHPNDTIDINEIRTISLVTTSFEFQTRQLLQEAIEQAKAEGFEAIDYLDGFIGFSFWARGF